MMMMIMMNNDDDGGGGGGVGDDECRLHKLGIRISNSSGRLYSIRTEEC